LRQRLNLFEQRRSASAVSSDWKLMERRVGLARLCGPGVLARAA